MATAQPHLEHRATGFDWRRRVPARARSRFEPDFFCFPLRTHVPRETAERARRLTAISGLCFNAEPDVSPDVTTNILVTYARIEIDLCDRLRAPAEAAINWRRPHACRSATRSSAATTPLH